MVEIENIKPMSDDKMIKVSKRTYDRLCNLGKFQESFDQLISRIIDENEKKEKK
jgi:hypothetical protein